MNKHEAPQNNTSEPSLDAPERTSETPEATPDTFESFVDRVNATDSDVLFMLNTTRPEAKTEFMEDDSLEYPANTHDNLHYDEIRDKLKAIDTLSEELEQSNLSDQERRLMAMSLDFNQRKNDFLMANILYNDDPTPENAEIHHLTNEALYGKPDYDTFLGLLNAEIDKIEDRELSPEEEAEYDELKAMLGFVEKPSRPLYRPSDETVKRFSELAEDYFQPIFNYIPEGQETFTVEEATEITERMLRDITDDDSAWHAEYEADRTAANVSQHTKTISFPGKRAAGDYTRKSLKKILVHEFGTHALRGIPYEKASAEILRTGLPDYEVFEEGVAKVMEAAVDGKYDSPNGRHYISIGLANFMDKDFRETYEIQKRLGHLASGKDQSNLSFNSVQRAFRGTDRLPNNKDLVYFEGSTKVWQYIEENLDNPDLFDNLFLAGKTDYTNPDHERIAYEAKVGSF